MTLPAIETLLAQFADQWKAFDALPARPDDTDWVQARLALMYERDQAYRDLYVQLVDAGDGAERARFAPMVKAADLAHQMWLAAWLTDHRWPRISNFGAAACEHAWMIVLHADNDTPFQRRVVGAMEPLLKAQEVNPVHYAALVDRVALAAGGVQRFGMFYRVEDGVEVPYPVEDPSRLSERRDALGIGDVKFRR
jgi:hypothetical protein